MLGHRRTIQEITCRDRGLAALCGWPALAGDSRCRFGAAPKCPLNKCRAALPTVYGPAVV